MSMERKSGLLSGSEVVQHHRNSAKELPEIGVKLFEPSGSWFESNKLSDALEDRYTLLKEPRIERDTLLSVAKWDEEKNKVIVVKKRGKEWETYGHYDSAENHDILNPEEALFLLESNSLALMLGNVQVSMEMSYSLLLSSSAGCSFDEYRVFSHLSRLGYKLIRHKKPESDKKTNDECASDEDMIIIDDDKSVDRTEKVQSVKKQINLPKARKEEVVVIESSDSDTDVEIVDEFDGSISRDIIYIEDDDSSDSDIVMIESPGLVEFPLEKWSYVHRKKFLSGYKDNGLPVLVDALVVSQLESDIFEEFPSIKGRKNWLFRPEEILIPENIWPFHYKYLIDVSEERLDNRGRGYYRGKFNRSRSWMLHSQIKQMKSYTVQLMNTVTELINGRGGMCGILPPPPRCMAGARNSVAPRDFNSWGRINCNSEGFNQRTNFSDALTEPLEVSDDSEDAPGLKRCKNEGDDVKPKKIKLDLDQISEGSASTQQTDIIEDSKPDKLSLDDAISVKSENTCDFLENVIKSDTEIKCEDKDENSQSQDKESSDLTRDDVTNSSSSPSIASDALSTDLSVNTLKENIVSQVNEVKPSKQALEDQKDSDIVISADSSNESTYSGCPLIVEQSFSISSISAFSDVNKTTQRSEVTDSKDKAKSENSDMDHLVSSSSSTDVSKTETASATKTDGFDKSDSGSQDKNSENIPTDSQCNSNCVEATQLQDSDCGTNVNPAESENSQTVNTVPQPVSIDMSDETESVIIETEKLPESDCVTETKFEDKSNMDKPTSEILCRMDDYLKNDLELNPQKPVCTEEPSDKNASWKELKENDKSCVNIQDHGSSTDADVPYGKPLIEEKHCKSLGDVLSQLQIFGQYEKKNDGNESVPVEVKYDVYLPTSNYFRHLPPFPDFRLIILRLEDSLPDAEEMRLLREKYNDKKGFLFAVILRESIAYYLYDTVCLPFNVDPL